MLNWSTACQVNQQTSWGFLEDCQTPGQPVGTQVWFYDGRRLRFDALNSFWHIRISNVVLKPSCSLLFQPRNSPGSLFPHMCPL